MTIELQELLESRTLTPPTIKMYEKAYDKLYTNLGKILISQSSQDDIIDSINELGKSISQKYTFANIVIMIYNLKKMNDSKLQKYRDNLRVQRTKHIEKNNTEKSITLPSYDELKKFVENLYKEQKYREYIINFLMFKFGLRNLDLNLFITDNKEDINDNDNFIFLKKTEIDLIINNYKTYKTYGQKKIKIRLKPFTIACNNLLGEMVIPVEPISQGKYIQRVTMDGIGEGNIFKILIKHCLTMKNPLNEIKKIATTRGTDVNTVIEYYNITL